MDTASAIRQLRADPANADLIRDAYLDEDPRKAAERYELSGEFSAVLKLLGPDVVNTCILDLGAGNGIASSALARRGAWVLGLDPDPGPDVGLSALVQSTDGLRVSPIQGIGEAIPLSDSSVDTVFARQVLHHARDLPRLVAECARVLRPGGTLLTCRDHVVNDDAQLEQFLSAHPVHQLAGGEHAFTKVAYLAALSGAGLRVETVLGPFDSLLNAFPAARTEAELRDLPRDRLRARLGFVGSMIGSIAPAFVRARLNDRGAGRLYSFLARKP